MTSNDVNNKIRVSASGLHYDPDMSKQILYGTRSTTHRLYYLLLLTAPLYPLLTVRRDVQQHVALQSK